MKATNILLVTCILMIILGGASLYYANSDGETLPTFINKHTTTKKYIIKKANKIVDSTDTLDEAIKIAEQITRVIAINTYNDEWIYTDLNPFMIFTETSIHDFSTFEEALEYARGNGYTEIYHKNDKEIIWKKEPSLNMKSVLNIPLINQYPELPRGCEVTSLAMLLKHVGIKVDKMILAEEIKKDLTPYSISADNKITYGNPYEGFVGNMYDLSKNGYGVYYGPIIDLAKEYCGNKVINLTELAFEEVLFLIEQGNPVWIITNSSFKALDDTYFQYWHTSSGVVKVTKKLHAVVMTGFDEHKIYINDPLYSSKNIAVNRDDFKKAWEQMGSQAMTILK